MKTVKTILFSSIFIYMFIALTGCETESSDQIALQITPNTARVRVRESIEFTASGFADYTWKLSNTTMGALSTTRGDSTVYTAFTSSSNEVQVLTVSANSIAGTTNDTSVSAEALISHY